MPSRWNQNGRSKSYCTSFIHNFLINFNNIPNTANLAPNHDRASTQWQSSSFLNSMTTIWTINFKFGFIRPVVTVFIPVLVYYGILQYFLPVSLGMASWQPTLHWDNFWEASVNSRWICWGHRCIFQVLCQVLLEFFLFLYGMTFRYCLNKQTNKTKFLWKWSDTRTALNVSDILENYSSDQFEELEESLVFNEWRVVLEMMCWEECLSKTSRSWREKLTSIKYWTKRLFLMRKFSSYLQV